MFGCINLICCALRGVFTCVESIFVAICCRPVCLPPVVIIAPQTTNCGQGITDSCNAGLTRMREGGEKLIQDMKNFCCPPTDVHEVELVGVELD